MKIKLLFSTVGIILIGIVTIICLYFSRAIVNFDKYTVLGVDVSSYQGNIDWDIIESQGVKFAFIKATEGSGMTDDYISQNLKNISNTNMYYSAYHFFSFDSAGETQAENFINAVGKNAINLPPVVDVEFYGDKFKNPPTKEEASKILRPLLLELEEYYGVKPIIYTTSLLYYKYIYSEFSDYPLWIRNVNCEPTLIDWDFWQFSDIGVLDGYYGTERCIDLNVYNGDIDNFISNMHINS